MANRGRPAHAVPVRTAKQRSERLRLPSAVSGPLATGAFVALVLAAVVAIVAFAPQEAGRHLAVAADGEPGGVAAPLITSAPDEPWSGTEAGLGSAIDDESALDEEEGQAPRSQAPKHLEGYRWPVSKGRITSFFDVRDDGFLVVRGKRVSEGMEIASACDTKVKAAHAGIVLAAGRRFGEHAGFSGPLDAVFERLQQSGQLKSLPVGVVIDDGNGYRSVYGHLAKAMVEPGQEVKAGQAIGLPRARSGSEGCHMRYELVRMDAAWMRVAREHVRRDGYPRWLRERVDPLRVLSLSDPKAPRPESGVVRPQSPPRADPSEGPPE
jgi:murein DD-endopeptidase MepM/ murein hydrolase activator NlpD